MRSGKSTTLFSSELSTAVDCEHLAGSNQSMNINDTHGDFHKSSIGAVRPDDRKPPSMRSIGRDS